tara:strand:+ start:7634 stop:8956 length:1323 start_codon:yes stop_codon:yes gene_type:complete
MCNRSLRCRVIISLLIVLMLGFGTLAFNLYNTRDQLRRSILFIQAHEIGANLNAQSDFTELPTHYAGGELSYTLYSADGNLLWYSNNLDRPRRLYRGTLEDEIQLIRTTIRSGRGYVISAPVTLTDGAILMVSKEDKLERQLIGNLFYQRTVRSLLLLIPFCLFAVGLLYLLMRWTLNPIQKAVELAEGIGPHDPNRRIPLNKLPGEVLPLARVANNGLDRLAQAYAYEQHIVGDAAHALRTPLAVLGLRLRQCSDNEAPDWPAINREFEQVHKLANQLLSLAHQDRIHASGQSDIDQTDLARVVREAAGTMLPLFETHGRNIELHLIDGVIVQGNPDLLREAIRNVLENALCHGAGVVTITQTNDTHTSVILRITDEGAGVAPESQEEMFVRFRKGHENSTGSGLGLAIVRSTLRNAGGDVRFTGAKPCTLEMRFRLIA